MGFNDHIGDYRPELPPDAGQNTEFGFEPDDDWISAASPELQHKAMRFWFLTRYEDPVNNTPYMGSEGGYLYIHGGPYDAQEELNGRFGHLCSEEAIQAVIEDVETDDIIEWAPMHYADYDAQFEYGAIIRGGAYQSFLQRLKEADALAAAQVDRQCQKMLRQLLYGSLIAALEAYLADTMLYWVAEEESVFRRFVSTCEEFRKRKLVLSDILDRMDTLEDEVRTYLQDLVWHRLDKVVPLMTGSLGIAIPSIKKLMKHIVTRHDIIHRGGKTKEGQDVAVSAKLLSGLRKDVLAFVDGVEFELDERFPP